MTENPLQLELQTYSSLKDELIKHHKGKYVLIRGNELIDTYDSFDSAARAAIKQFGDGPYLIRQVGIEPEFKMPASVAYQPIYAHR